MVRLSFTSAHNKFIGIIKKKQQHNLNVKSPPPPPPPPLPPLQYCQTTD